MKTTFITEQLIRDVATGAVIEAHWRINAEDGNYTSSEYGSVTFVPDPNSPDFKPFEELTPAIVETWIKAELDIEVIEKNLEVSIELQKNPPVLVGLPW